MSYARFADDSDVYVFLSSMSDDDIPVLECCACSLTTDGSGNYCTSDTIAMLRHLHDHERAGHKVPARCYDGLGEDALRNDLLMAGLEGAERTTLGQWMRLRLAVYELWQALTALVRR